MLLDPKNQWLRLGVSGCIDSFHVEKYVESLVLHNHGGRAIMRNDGVDDATRHKQGEADEEQHP